MMVETKMRLCQTCRREYEDGDRDGYQRHVEEFKEDHQRARVIGKALTDGSYATRQLVEERLLRWQEELAAAETDARAEHDLSPARNLMAALARWLHSDPKISGYRISHHGLSAYSSPVPRTLNSMVVKAGFWGSRGIVLMAEQKDYFSVSKHVEGLFSPFSEAEGRAVVDAMVRGLAHGSKFPIGPIGEVRTEPGYVRVELPQYQLYGNTKVALANGLAHDPPASQLPWLPDKLFPEGWR